MWTDPFAINRLRGTCPNNNVRSIVSDYSRAVLSDASYRNLFRARIIDPIDSDAFRS